MKIPATEALKTYCGIEPGMYGIKVEGAGTESEPKVEPREFLQAMSKANGLTPITREMLVDQSQVSPTGELRYPRIIGARSLGESDHILQARLALDSEEAAAINCFVSIQPGHETIILRDQRPISLKTVFGKEGLQQFIGHLAEKSRANAA